MKQFWLGNSLRGYPTSYQRGDEHVRRGAGVPTRGTMMVPFPQCRICRIILRTCPGLHALIPRCQGVDGTPVYALKHRLDTRDTRAVPPETNETCGV